LFFKYSEKIKGYQNYYLFLKFTLLAKWVIANKNHTKTKINMLFYLIQEAKESICCMVWLIARGIVEKTIISTLKMTFTESTIKLFVEYI
jgi:hypothetical protein